MFRKAAIIQAIFFSAAAVLVISSLSLVAFVGSQGLQVFKFVSPLEFFTGTTWNPTAAANSDEISSDRQQQQSSSDATSSTVDAGSGGALLSDGQRIEPSEPSAEQSANSNDNSDNSGQPIAGGQLIEPSEPSTTQDSNQDNGGGGQLLGEGQMIDPSQPADESAPAAQSASDSSTANSSTTGSSTAGRSTAESATVDSTNSIAEPDALEGKFGILPLLVGSLITALLTLVVSGPLAILVAVFMVEIAPDPMRRLLRTTVEIFASLPSVIFGLLGLVYVVPWVRESFHVGLGKGILAASVVLVFMTQPTIVTIAEDALRSLPTTLREAARGVGATRWQMIWGVLLPASRTGLFTAVILGMGRAIGETMAVQMVIGNITEYIPTNLVDGATTMPAAIVTQLPEAASPAHRAALIMVAFVLLITAFLLIALARLSVRNTAARA